MHQSWVGNTMIASQSIAVRSGFRGSCHVTEPTECKIVTGKVEKVTEHAVLLLHDDGKKQWYEIGETNVGGLRVIEVVSP